MNIKSLIILVTTSALLTNCAHLKKGNSQAEKIKPSLVADRKKTEVITQTTQPITPPQPITTSYLPPLTNNTSNENDDEAQVKNSTGPYPDLINADDPATEEQIYQEVSPIIKAPTNVITP